MDKRLTASFRKQVRRAVDQIKTSVEARVEIGRVIVGLQKAMDSRDVNGRTTYLPAMELVRQWSGNHMDLPDSSLRQMYYVAERASREQVKVLVEAGASFSAIYASVVVCGQKGPDAFRKYVQDVKRGTAQVGKHMMSRVSKWQSHWKTPKGQQNSAGAGVRYLCSFTLTGGETENHCRNITTSLLSAVLRMGYDVEGIANESLKRVLRLARKAS